MKIKAFPNSSGSGQWRVTHPMKYLQRLGHTISLKKSDVGATTTIDEILGYDAILPQGIINIEALKLILAVRRDYGTKIILDFDDMIKVTRDNPHYKDHKIWDASPILQSFAKFADGITTTGEHLAKYLRTLNKNVFILPNYMDLEYWQYPIKKNTTDKVRICYVGSVTHLMDIKMIAPVLKKILKTYKDKVELVMVGDLRWREVFKGFDNVDCLLGVPFDSYALRLNGLMMDIGIAPLRKTNFNLCKSPIKWMENSIAGGATVASSTVYDRVIRHGENGFLANNKDEWFKYLSELITNAPLRKKMHHRALGEVLKLYSLEKHIGEWERVYETIINK